MTIDDREVAAMGPGAVVLVGVARGDTDFDVKYLARKTSQLRIFDDEEGRLNRSIEAVKGAFLVVSQFTLYADTRKGRRPDFFGALEPGAAAPLFAQFVAAFEQTGASPVGAGVFGAEMKVALENDGPVTIIVES